MPPKRSAGAGNDADGNSGGEGGGRKLREWGHAEGFPLSDVEVNAQYDGVVTNVSPYGVFVDFGATKDGLLRVPTKVGRGYKRGMEVKSMVVVSVDADAGRVVMQPDERTLPEPPPRTRNKRPASAGASTRKAPRTRKKREWDHNEGTPLEELREGDTFEGTVTNVSPYGVFADIGAVKDARLSVPAKIGKCFRIGDVIQNCTLESLDAETGRLAVTIADVEEVVRDLPPKEKVSATPKVKAKAKSAPKAKAKVKAAANAQTKQQGSQTKLERLRIGTVVDGLVANKTQYGVFVNIGCEKDALLRVPKRIGKEFRRGDQVFGMRIEEVDVEKRLIAVSLDNPELEIPDDQGASERAPSASKNAPTGAAKAKAKVKASAKAPAQELRHAGALPLTRFKAGGVANGTVTRITSRGVFVNIGAVTDGLLELPRNVAKQFRVGDEVHGMAVDSVNKDEERVMLSLEEPELEESVQVVNPVGGKGRGRGRGSGKGDRQAQEDTRQSRSPPPRAGAKAKAKAKAKDWGHDNGTLIEDLEIGAYVSGVVTNSNQFGVFLNIGAEKDAKLQVSREEGRAYRRGDHVDAVISYADVEAYQILADLPPQRSVKAPPRPKAKARAGSSPGQGRAPSGPQGGAAKPRPPATRTSPPARPRAKGASAGGSGRR